MALEWVLVIVLGTAVLHAAWNAMAKGVGDRWVASLLIGAANAFAGIIAAVATAVAGVFPAPESWPYLVTSAVLQTGYLVLLTWAYAHGDMSRLYPIARGTAPVVVTVVAVTVLQERLTVISWAGLVVLTFALAVLAFGRGLPRRGAGMGLALATGLTIGAYSLVDGIGVRHSGAPLAYIGWLFVIQGPLAVLVSLRWGGPRLTVRVRQGWILGFAGGLISVLAYGIVVWAQSLAPLALVSALRETSVVWAVLIAFVILGERPRRREIIAVVLAAAGALALQLGA